MTDPDLIAKKLAFIETCVQELKSLGEPDRISRDVKERRFVEHTLQIAIQAVLDVASHIVSDARLGEPRTNRELFDLLDRAGWLDERLTGQLRNMVGFRNVVVHGYEIVDLGILRDILETRLEDLLLFTRSIRDRLDEDAG